MPIRTLRPGERIPIGEPRRYPNARGYVRLRWHGADGPGEHVEVYEHRVRDGVVVEGEVHHRNSNPGDNRGANLAVTRDAAEHKRHHRRIDRTTVVRRYEAGESTTEIAAALGCNPATLSRVLRAEGVVMRRPVWNRVEVDVGELRRLHAEGVRVPGIAAALGVGTMAVRRAMVEEGLPPFPVGRPPEETSPTG